jgi:nitrite reductase/ring-hydroxylating ferredoxin subunit
MAQQRFPHDDSISVSVGELLPGGTTTFRFVSRGWPNHGFLHHDGTTVRAWLNRCAHLPLSLDLGLGEFFDESGEYFHCANHGAIFRTTDGVCEWGPCVGRALMSLPVRVEGETAVVDVSEVDAGRPVHPEYADDDD